VTSLEFIELSLIQLTIC